MAKYIPLDEAADELGISVDDLKEMIDRKDVRAFRDGASWKFKSDELERVKSTLSDKNDPLKTVDELSEVDDLDLAEEDSAESLLVEGASDKSSPVIGESGTGSAADSDLKLAADSDLKLSAEEDQPGPAGGSDVLGGEAEKASTGSDTGVLSKGKSDLDLKLDDDELELTIEAGSDIKPGDDAAIDLDGDDDLVLDGVDSDVTLGGGDSGINLANPADSGLSLEDESLSLGEGGSDADSLELGDDDMLSLEGDFDTDEATELKADDDFLLTPIDDEVADDESDSGSQVIALDSEEFDDSAATMLDADAADLVEEVDTEFVETDAGEMPTAPAASSKLVPTSAEEADFSIWNILSLACVLVLMCLTGVMMMDVINNIWSWNGTYSFSSSIMDPLVSFLE